MHASEDKSLFGEGDLIVAPQRPHKKNATDADTCQPNQYFAIQIQAICPALADKQKKAIFYPAENIKRNNKMLQMS